MFCHIRQLLVISLMVISCSTPILGEAKQYLRGAVLTFKEDPGVANTAASYDFWDDGVVIIQKGKIENVVPWVDFKQNIKTHTPIQHFPHGLIMPGFIDTHVHSAQLDMIAAPTSGDLLAWLHEYTFPFERRLQDPHYAAEVAEAFFLELLKNGTTTANIFPTFYVPSVDAIFHAAQQRGMAVISGQVLGDKNLPEALQQNPDSAIAESEMLIKRWHHKPGTRLEYALILRFAPTTSKKLFQLTEELLEKYPSVHFHSHVSENKKEVAWVKSLFPQDSYTGVYDRYHLLGRNSVLAHGVWLQESEMTLLQKRGSSIAFCPTSNLFLGSGLFDLAQADAHHLKIGIGTDVGAGTSLSLLQTLNEAYKVLQLQQQPFTALRGFYFLTLGGARALNLQQSIGSISPGKYADLVVLDMQGGTSLLQRRMRFAKTLEEKLFVLMTLGDDRSILATYIQGKQLYTRQKSA